MNFSLIDLSHIPGREDSLKSIQRYMHHITPVMYYRTNLLTHSRRVSGHLEEAVEDILSVHPGFDVELARTLALVHDDAEIITGDVQLIDKEGMTKEQKRELWVAEEAAAAELVKRYGPKINGLDYAKLLELVGTKEVIEAQFVSFFDKFDGGGEAWHEVWAGNERFLLPAGGHHGRSGGYVRRLNAFLETYPAMRAFFKEFPGYLPEPFDFKSAAKTGKPHTVDSLKEDSGFPPYERWKKSVIKKEGTSNLTTRVEFP
ncbi:MAG: HD domain-containing protein [archaeon]|nr:HD domain-containing protein [archaeon]MCR4323602.1 HD domain-containing protein [Nanoarchaeota archaeon]